MRKTTESKKPAKHWTHEHSTKLTGLLNKPFLVVLTAVMVFFLARIFSVFIVTLWPVINGWSSETSTAWLNQNSSAKFALSVVLAVSTIWILKFVLRVSGMSWKNIGLGKLAPMAFINAIIGFGIYWLINIVVIIILLPTLVPGIDFNQEQQLGFDKDKLEGLSLVPVFFSLVLVPAFIEELLFRGFLYTGLRRRLNIIGAGFITSALFALAHLQFGSGQPLLWTAAIDTFVLSAVLVYLRETHRSLWPPIILHGLKNTLAFMFLFVFSTTI